MGFGRGALRGILVIVATLVCINLIVYALLPPAQPLPAIPYGEQARQAAQQAGTLAGFYDFDSDIGEAWHAVERDRLDGATFQYMAQNIAPVFLPVGCFPPYTLEIAVLDNHIRPSWPESITLIVNNKPVDVVRERGVRRTIYRATFTQELAGRWLIVVGIARLFRPSSIFAEEDDRLIGAGLDWVRVTGTRCD